MQTTGTKYAEVFLSFGGSRLAGRGVIWARAVGGGREVLGDDADALDKTTTSSGLKMRSSAGRETSQDEANRPMAIYSMLFTQTRCSAMTRWCIHTASPEPVALPSCQHYRLRICALLRDDNVNVYLQPLPRSEHSPIAKQMLTVLELKPPRPARPLC
jgi:hypothetical protein